MNFKILYILTLLLPVTTFATFPEQIPPHDSLSCPRISGVFARDGESNSALRYFTLKEESSGNTFYVIKSQVLNPGSKKNPATSMIVADGLKKEAWGLNPENGWEKMNEIEITSCSREILYSYRFDQNGQVIVKKSLSIDSMGNLERSFSFHYTDKPDDFLSLTDQRISD